MNKRTRRVFSVFVIALFLVVAVVGVIFIIKQDVDRLDQLEAQRKKERCEYNKAQIEFVHDMSLLMLSLPREQE